MLKIAQAKLEDILPRCGLPPEALAIAQGGTEVANAIAALEQAGLLVEASRLFAHALPRREAVWWACMCARGAPPPPGVVLSEADLGAREGAENWVRQQSEDIRRAAMDKARAAGFQTPEAWAGAAAFWSGDNIAPPTAPQPIPPPPELTGVAVAGAIALAAARGDPQAHTARLARFLAAAKDIASGGSGRIAAEGAGLTAVGAA